MSSYEQQARDLLEQMCGAFEWNYPQRLTASDVVELANMLAELARLRQRVAELEAECDRLREDLATANDDYNRQFIGRSRAEDALKFAVGFLRAMACKAVVNWGDLAGMVRPYPIPPDGGLYRHYARRVLDRIAEMREGGQGDAD
jgi:hypothetical protein